MNEQDKRRADFEAWVIKEKSWSIWKLAKDVYTQSQTHYAWEVWKAALDSAPSPDPVAWMWEYAKTTHVTTDKNVLPELLVPYVPLYAHLQAPSPVGGGDERELLSLALNNCQIALIKSEQDATERWRGGVQYIANKICGEIPDGYVITLEMENGSASVSLFDWQNEENIELPEQDEPYVCKWLTEALDAAKAKHDGGVFVQACRPEDREMLQTPAGKELLSAAHKALQATPADAGSAEPSSNPLQLDANALTEAKRAGMLEAYAECLSILEANFIWFECGARSDTITVRAYDAIKAKSEAIK